MRQETPDEKGRRQLRALWTLLAFTAVALLFCAVAGLILALGDPDAGSSADDALRTATAASGLVTGVLAGVAAIYAQVKNLWRFAPPWFRYGTWVVLAAIILAGAIGSAAAG